MFKNISTILLIAVLFAGCKKEYPDDKRRYTRSPFKRLTCHSWAFRKAEPTWPLNYEFRFDDADPTILHFNEDGTCDGAGFSSTYNEVIYLFNFDGKWEFVENDSKIKVTYKINPNYNKIWTIQRLDRTGLTIFCDSIKYTLKKR